MSGLMAAFAALTLGFAPAVGSFAHASHGGHHGHGHSPHNLAPGLYEVPCHPKDSGWRCFISVPIEIDPFGSLS